MELYKAVCIGIKLHAAVYNDTRMHACVYVCVLCVLCVYPVLGKHVGPSNGATGGFLINLLQNSVCLIQEA